MGTAGVDVSARGWIEDLTMYHQGSVCLLSLSAFSVSCGISFYKAARLWVMIKRLLAVPSLNPNDLESKTERLSESVCHIPWKDSG